MAARFDLEVDAGATFTFTLTWYTDAARSAVVNLTGYSARMDVRAAGDVSPAPAGTPLVQLTSGSGITLGGALGTVVVTLTAAQTGALEPTDELAPHVYDLELVAPGGAVTRLVEGRVVVSPEVTR